MEVMMEGFWYVDQIRTFPFCRLIAVFFEFFAALSSANSLFLYTQLCTFSWFEQVFSGFYTADQQYLIVSEAYNTRGKTICLVYTVLKYIFM